MKGMLRGKKKKEACEKDPPELCVDGQPFSNPSTPQEIIDRRNTGPSNDEALVSHRNSMFNMLLGRNKIINAITGSSLTAVSTAPSPLGSSAPASYPSNRQAAPEPPAVTLVRRTSNRLLNSTRFSSYETLRSTYDASDPLNNQFSRSTEDLALDENSDVYAGPLIPSVSDPGAYRNIPGHDTGSHSDANDPYIRRRQQQPHTFYGHDASSSSSNDITGYGVTINGHPLIAGDGTAMTHQQPITNLSGYLAKKTDFRGGWKVYEATMRGGKLYFYKPASQAARHQVSDTDGKGMALQVADFDPAASAFLFEPSPAAPLVTHYQFGLKVTELEVKSMRFRRYACVLLFEGRIVICRRKWIRSSRAQASAILLSDDENANGYYTKWKIDDTYPIQHVEVMEAASTGFDSQSPMNDAHPLNMSSATGNSSATHIANSANHTQHDKHGRARAASDTLKDTSPMPTQLGFQIFVSSRDEVAAPTTFSASPIVRLFVARTDEARRTFIKRLQDARQLWEVRQQKTTDNKKTEQVLPRTSTDVGRTRRFWGTSRHPELIVEMIDTETTNDTEQQEASDTVNTDQQQQQQQQQYRVMGGSVDAMIHELIHQTGRTSEQEIDPDEFLSAFLASYHLFTDSVRLLQELNKYANHVSKDAKDAERQPIERIAHILRTWIKEDETLLNDLAVSELHSLLDDVLASRGIQDTAAIKDILDKRRKQISGLKRSTLETAVKSREQSTNISSVDLSNLTVTGLSPAIFLKLNPTEFAQQICIYHLQQLQRSNPAHVSNFMLSRDASSTSDAFSFTPTRPHFLTRLLLDHLLDGGQSMTVIRRAITLNHWIRVGMASWELGDAAGWAAIALGICSPGVTRLRETWREVEPTHAQCIREKWVPQLLEMGLFESEGERTIQAIRLSQGQASAYVPYLGSVQQAVMQLNESLPDRIASPSSGQSPDTPLEVPDVKTGRSTSLGRGAYSINFDKYRQMYRIYQQATKHFPRVSREIPTSQWPTIPHPALQDYMSQLAARDVDYDPARYFSSSLLCEYGLDGHYYEMRSGSRPTRINAILAPLSFVDPLPDAPLLYLASMSPQSLAVRVNNSSTNLSSSRRSSELSVRSTLMRATNSSSNTTNTNGHGTTGNQTNNSNSNSNSNSGQFGKSPPHTPNNNNNNNNSSSSSNSHQDTSTNLLPTSPLHDDTAAAAATDSETTIPKSPRGGGGGASGPQGSSWWGALRKQSSTTQNDKQDNEFGVWLDSNDLYATARVQPPGTSQRPLLTKVSSNEASSSPASLSDSFVLGITVLGGAPERLVEVLIYGMPTEADRLVDELSRPLTIGLRGLKMEFDHTDYTRMFFATFRSFCSPTWLFEQLVRRFIDTHAALEMNKIHNSAQSPKPLITLANRGRLQRTILQICASWLDQYFTDILDSPKLRRRFTRLMHQAIKESLRFTSETDPTLQRIGFEIKSTATVTLNWILKKTLEPAMDTTLVNLEQQYPIYHPDLDKDTPRAILTHLNAAATVLFRQISLADWVQTVTVLELQTLDPMVWHPTQRRVSTLDEELVLPDIFTILDRSRRAGTTTRILTALPWSIQKCCQFRDRIRTWVISRVTSTSAQWNQRVEWISKFLQIIQLCRGSTQSLVLSPDATAIETFGGNHRVPSLVERAIASALVSPESRLFLRTWQEVAARRNTTLDTLTQLIMAEPQKAVGMTRSGTVKGSSRSRSITLVPCIGWAIESMLQICYRLPDMLPESSSLLVTSSSTSAPASTSTTATANTATSTALASNTTTSSGTSTGANTSTPTSSSTASNTATTPSKPSSGTMISLEKRLQLHHMIDILRQYQAQMEKSSQQQLSPLTACAFLMTPDALTLQSNWRPLRELSQQESMQVSKQSIQHNPRLHKTTRVFYKLLHEQQEKLRRDGKERERLERELHDMSMTHRRQGSASGNAAHYNQYASSLNSPSYPGATSTSDYRSSSGGKMKGVMRLMKGVIGTSSSSSSNLTSNTATSSTYNSSTNNNGDGGNGTASSRPLVRRVSSLNHHSKPTRKGSNRPSTVINLISAQAQVEHGYAKRPHVFRVITEEGGQHLLQAADRSSMLQWLEAIAHVSKTAAIKRRSTQPQSGELPTDMDSSSSPPPPLPNLPDKGGLRTPMFGIDLASLMTDDQLPLVVEKCITEVERRGLEEVGIYRVPGMQSAIDRLKNCFNQDAMAVDLSSDDWADINVVACLLKQFFRELPEPLLTNGLYDEFIKATKIEEYNDRMFALKDLLAMLPRRNYILFQRLIEHLERVTEFEEINHMYATNLAIVFGPSLIRAPPGPASLGASFNNLGHHQNIVKTYILQYHWFFDVEDEPEETGDMAVVEGGLEEVEEEMEPEEEEAVAATTTAEVEDASIDKEIDEHTTATQEITSTSDTSLPINTCTISTTTTTTTT